MTGSFTLYAALLPHGDNPRLTVATHHRLAYKLLSAYEAFYNHGAGRSIFSKYIFGWAKDEQKEGLWEKLWKLAAIAAKMAAFGFELNNKTLAE